MTKCTTFWKVSLDKVKDDLVKKVESHNISKEAIVELEVEAKEAVQRLKKYSASIRALLTVQRQVGLHQHAIVGAYRPQQAWVLLNESSLNFLKYINLLSQVLVFPTSEIVFKPSSIFKLKTKVV